MTWSETGLWKVLGVLGPVAHGEHVPHLQATPAASLQPVVTEKELETKEFKGKL